MGIEEHLGYNVLTTTLDEVNRVTSQTDEVGSTITLAYDAPGRGATEVTDPLGATTISPVQSHASPISRTHSVSVGVSAPATL